MNRPEYGGNNSGAHNLPRVFPRWAGFSHRRRCASAVGALGSGDAGPALPRPVRQRHTGLLRGRDHALREAAVRSRALHRDRPVRPVQGHAPRECRDLLFCALLPRSRAAERVPLPAFHLLRRGRTPYFRWQPLDPRISAGQPAPRMMPELPRTYVFVATFYEQFVALSIVLPIYSR